MLGDLLWSDFTHSLELIFTDNHRSTQAPPPVPAKLERASPRKTLCIFFEISPAEIFLDLEKGVSGGSPTVSSRGGAAPVGTADALRAFVL
jgi:hypothetical protein